MTAKRKSSRREFGWPHFIVSIGLVILFLALACAVTLLEATFASLGDLVSLPIASTTGRSLLFLIAVAFITMCLIQVIRSLVPVRGWFHLRQITRYFSDTEREIADINTPWVSSATDSPAPKGRSNEEDVAQSVHGDLETLTQRANVSDQTVFFDAPIEQVCGQIGAVTEFLLSELASDLKSRQDPTSSSMQEPDPEKQEPDPENHIRQRDLGLLAILTGKSSVHKAGELLKVRWDLRFPGDPAMEPVRLRAGVRNTLAFQLQRSLDQLQIKVSSKWKRLLRLTSVVTSCAICLSATHWRAPSPGLVQSNLAGLATALMAGIVSGYVATVFRDIISIIERGRR